MKKIKFLIGLTILLGLSCSTNDSVELINGDNGNGGGEVIVDEPDPDTGDGTALTAKQIVTAMGPGFNLGNTFENGNNTTTYVAAKPIIDLFKNAGMKHIRIPVTWMDRFTANDHLADGNGNVDYQNTRFKELVKVIDYAISLDLYVVINTHHEHWLKDFYNGSATFDNKFSTLWTGIATYFKDYSHKLIFEVLNEPEGTLGEWGGTWPDPNNATALTYTRKVNKVGYDAIRAAGGNNTTRLVMVGTNGQGNEVMIEEVYPSKATLPGGGTDKYLSIQVHSYNPWAFCGQTGSNAAFPGNSTFENAIKKVGIHSRLLDVPVNYGEFGVGRDGNTAERNTDIVRGYYKTFATTTLSENMSYSVWCDRGWFGLINSTGTSFTNNIVPTMLAN
ncbi:glycoside hydrolase family 5 protein [Confluentibacter citreus]|uniref:glycoside hydrolase family 5 protein n=1 Tax=Confluentibacter citreus TaxID=2007307 RepID=UPI000C289B98|nr:glycoside hydrolase family 5 protein [Confluentibacter citreus]